MLLLPRYTSRTREECSCGLTQEDGVHSPGTVSMAVIVVVPGTGHWLVPSVGLTSVLLPVQSDQVLRATKGLAATMMLPDISFRAITAGNSTNLRPELASMADRKNTMVEF